MLSVLASVNILSGSYTFGPYIGVAPSVSGGYAGFLPFVREIGHRLAKLNPPKFKSEDGLKALLVL